MTPTSVLVIGGEVPAGFSGLPSTLIQLPGEEQRYATDDRCTVIKPKDIDECMLILRNHYADHQAIATLGGLKIIADHPIEGTGATAPSLANVTSPDSIRSEWAPRIEEKLCELLDDLGNCPMDSWKGARHAIMNGEYIANSPSSRELMYAHAGEPAVVLGSGPSASEYLPQLARIRSGVRLFVADTILHGCLAAGIVPDYVCAIEREDAIEIVLDGHENCGATLIASPFISPKLAQKWGKNLLFWWSGDDISRWLDPSIEPMSSGRSSGSLALAAAAHAGCAQIYLIGHDLSFRNGASHAESAHPLAHSVNKEAMSDPSSVNPLTRRTYVEANHGGVVETSGLWNRVRGDLEGIIANHPNWRVYNVCNHGGARIAGAPVGDLPEMPMSLPPIKRLAASRVQSPLKRIDSVRQSLAVMEGFLITASEGLQAGCDMDRIAYEMQISRLVGPANASLFHYICRSVYSMMTLRMHMDASRGVSREVSQHNALTITITTLLAIVRRMEQEMPL